MYFNLASSASGLTDDDARANPLLNFQRLTDAVVKLLVDSQNFMRQQKVNIITSLCSFNDSFFNMFICNIDGLWLQSYLCSSKEYIYDTFSDTCIPLEFLCLWSQALCCLWMWNYLCFMVVFMLWIPTYSYILSSFIFPP